MIKNIPLSTLKLVSEHLKYSAIIPKLQGLIIIFIDRKCSNKFLRVYISNKGIFKKKI